VVGGSVSTTPLPSGNGVDATATVTLSGAAVTSVTFTEGFSATP